eukprot:CAMPEP_0182434360 /NCGR_PEP_ID=MMETSP1167-20130531/69360_1 /TAXON_ID=2988 /ORGANISM="Mallomonas Sp, Strain CCMP3275" /LENGTH=520 /DNA_ID=CAMNT_0024624159 /DNA_START=404 /DNA_END=1966 /DNA_ORIENTATION=-
MELSHQMRFTQVSCGRKHILGLLEGNIVVSWGIGFFGQLGHGDDSSWDSPKIIQTLDPHRLGDRVKTVVCGGSHSGVVTESGRIYMWGLNRNGQCGLVSKSDTVLDPRPMDFSEFGSIHTKHLYCGRNHTSMISVAGRVYTWGAAGFGRLGISESKKKQMTPVEVVALAYIRVTDLAVGDFHTLALAEDASVYSWGYNAEGQCGHGHVFNIRTPQRIVSFDNMFIKRVVCGATWSVAVSKSGDMFVWGYGDGGWLGLVPPKNMSFVDPETECGPEAAANRLKTVHSRSFESRHNVLAPTRVKLLAGYFVSDVRCGGAHCIVFGQRRTANEKSSEKRRVRMDHGEEDRKGGVEEGDVVDPSAVVEDEDEEDHTSSDDDDEEQREEGTDAKLCSAESGMKSPPSRPTPQQVFSWCRHKKIQHLSHALEKAAINVNMVDSHGNTLLIIACQNGHMNVCQLLIDHGADLKLANAKGNTVLHYCFAFNFKLLGDYLISRGADEFAVNNEGLTCYEGLTLSDLDAL